MRGLMKKNGLALMMKLDEGVVKNSSFKIYIIFSVILLPLYIEVK